MKASPRANGCGSALTGSQASLTSWQASYGPAEGLAELNLGEALAMFWERVSFLLVEDLRDAIVLHAAAFCKDNSFILLPGQTGSGKTRLALWYRRQGFDLATDEIVAVGNSESNELVLAGALARPIILKGSGESGHIVATRRGPTRATRFVLWAHPQTARSSRHGPQGRWSAASSYSLVSTPVPRSS